MISAIAILLAFVLLVIGLLFGGGLSLSGFLFIKRKVNPVSRRILFWLCGAVPAAVLGIILIKLKTDFSSPGGPPTAKEWENLFRFFSLAALLPGISLSAGGLCLLTAGLLIRK